MLFKTRNTLPIQKFGFMLTLFIAFFSSAMANNYTTEVIKAKIVNIEPIYMEYTLKKVATRCDSGDPRCWNVSYQKEAAKILQGYRVKLSYKDNTFTARMLNKPNLDYLKIRVKSDLLNMPSNVAINAAVVY